jgi:hypothetical protein
MAKRHKGRSGRPTTVDPVVDLPPFVADETPATAAAIETPSDISDEPSTREALLESVSPEALQADSPAETPIEVHLDEPTSPETEASAPARSADALTPVPASEPAALTPAAPPRLPLPTRGSALDAMSEFTEVNATLVAFLQGEGQAAISHFRALATAKTPADAIRLQVGEMQRAADASLTCFSVLARRATRFAEALRPR